MKIEFFNKSFGNDVAIPHKHANYFYFVMNDEVWCNLDEDRELYDKNTLKISISRAPGIGWRIVA